MFRRAVAIAMLMVTGSAVVQAQYPFIGPTRDVQYAGCIDTRACYLLTVTLGEITPWGFPGDFRYTNRGAKLVLESWYFERGGSYIPLGVVVPIGSLAWWEDAGYANLCSLGGIWQSCLGYARDDLFTNRGAYPIYQDYQLPQTWFGSVNARFVDRQGYLAQVTGTGSTVLTMVPEPSTYSLMAAGLIVVGIAARRRRRQMA
jgi:PEP-CTERM motif